MIRKVNEKDNDRLMKLVMKEPEINVYIIGNLENFGYNQSFFEAFGEFNKIGDMSAVLVRYFNSFNFYAEGDFEVQGFIDVIRKYDKLKMLVGKANIISKFQGTVLGLDKFQLQKFSVLKEIDSSFITDEKVVVKKAEIEDIEAIANLREGIEEFSSGTGDFKEILFNDFKKGISQGYYAEINGKIVSYAQTAAENNKSAMVVNVMTDKEHRKKGLASVCLKILCNNLIKQGKTLCLFYQNDEAGAIYRRIGFKEIDLWCMYTKAR